MLCFSLTNEKTAKSILSGFRVSMGYKKDIFGIFAYEFELLPKYLEFSNLVCGGEPASVDQWLHHFETAYKNHCDLLFGIYRYKAAASLQT